MLMKLAPNTAAFGDLCRGPPPVAARAVHCPSPLWMAPHTLSVVFQNTSKHTRGLHAWAKPAGQRLTADDVKDSTYFKKRNAFLHLQEKSRKLTSKSSQQVATKGP